jgi:hypothetical protein
MSAPMRSIYTNAARRHLRLFANWEPNRPIALGDYGRLDGDWFDRLGSLSEFQVEWTTSVSADGLSHFKFTSSDSVEVEANARGKGCNTRANVEVSFGRGMAVFMDAAGCTYESLADKRQLGDRLLKLQDFDRKWVVVTDLVRAERLIVAISANSNARITFEADASVKQIDLADGKLRLKTNRQTSIGYLVDAEKGRIPLLSLCGFRSRFWSPEKSFHTFGSAGESEMTAGDESDAVSDDFVQLS